jgi:uncharacterized protein
MAPSVASLHIYPIKSLGGFSVEHARITDRGFEHDRRWMLVDEQGTFVTQREIAEMACLHCSPLANGFRVTDVRGNDAIDLPWELLEGDELQTRVFNDPVTVRLAPIEWSAWFSKKLGRPVLLTFMPDASHRPVDPTYAEGITSLSDGYPFLILSQASLDDLNARLDVPLPMNRFRPNIVISGAEAFQEDTWKEITIGEVPFTLVKPCGRCAITTTDQMTGERSKEPLRTLATFRRRKGVEGAVVVDFGMNAMAQANGLVAAGDPIVA